METFKIMRNIVPYGKTIFNLGRSGNNILSCNSSINFCKSFISERVISYWNKLPQYCKTVESVISFKSSLQLFKKSNIHIANIDHFWEVSERILSRLEGHNYDRNRRAHIEYLLDNPSVARRRGINISS